MLLSSKLRYTLNYLSENTLHFLNYLFMVKVKVIETINRLKMCHFFLVFSIVCDSIIMPQKVWGGGGGILVLGCPSMCPSVRPSRFLIHTISFEPCMLLGFLNFIYGFLMEK